MPSPPAWKTGGYQIIDGQRLRRARRKDPFISIRLLAMALGVSTSCIRDYEARRACRLTDEKVQAIATVLGVPPESLLRRWGEPAE